MKNIFEDLWYGHIDPFSACKESNSDTEPLQKYIARHRQNLTATLTDAQKEIFEKFDDCYTELTEINERRIFTYAFKLGAQMAIGVLNDNNGMLK